MSSTNRMDTNGGASAICQGQTPLGQRRLCAVAAILLALALCVLLAAHVVPSRNAQSLVVSGTPAREREAMTLYPSEFVPTGDINVNTADATALTRIKGVGEKLAATIIAEREQNGRFARPEDLLAVKGIGASTLKKLLPQITLD